MELPYEQSSHTILHMVGDTANKNTRKLFLHIAYSYFYMTYHQVLEDIIPLAEELRQTQGKLEQNKEKNRSDDIIPRKIINANC